MKYTYIKIDRCAVVKRSSTAMFCVELLANSGGGLPIKSFKLLNDALAYAKALSDRITVANSNTPSRG